VSLEFLAEADAGEIRFISDGSAFQARCASMEKALSYTAGLARAKLGTWLVVSAIED